MSLFRSFLNWQLRLSHKFDDVFLPAHYSTVGWRVFFREMVPNHVHSNQKIYDIGSGKRPALEWSKEQRTEKNLFIVGADIAQDELELAPKGAYSETVVADICDYTGKEDGDLAICGCLLEHVADMNAAIRGAVSTLKPGGTLLIFVPNRNALFARLNLVLPERLKNRILNSLYSESQSQFIGFPAHYDQCTPVKMRAILERLGMALQEERYYHFSNYFMFFTPAHILWRLYQQIFIMLGGKERACENFILSARKLEERDDAIAFAETA